MELRKTTKNIGAPLSFNSCHETSPKKIADTYPVVAERISDQLNTFFSEFLPLVTVAIRISH